MEVLAIIYMAIVMIIWIICILAAVAITWNLRKTNTSMEYPERAGFGIASCSLFIVCILAALIWPIALGATFITMFVESRRKEE